MTETIESREEMYNFLARIYRVEVDNEFLSTMKTIDFKSYTGQAPIDKAFRMMGSYLERACESVLLDLARDYSRIFIGAGLARNTAAYPYESVYTSPEGIMEQDAHDAVVEAYSAEGLVKSDNYVEPADHVAFELEFMAVLCSKAAQAHANGNQTLAENYINHQKDFLNNHILRWIPRFARDVEGLANEDFYRAAALILRHYVEEEGKELGKS